MRILIVSHLLPALRAPHAGGRMIGHVVHELVARGHTVDVLAKVLPHERSDLVALRKVCSEVMTVESGSTKRMLIRNSARTAIHHPLDLIRWRGRRNNLLLAYHLARLLETVRYDLVQLELVQVLPLARVALGRAPVLQVVHDLDSKLAYRRMQCSHGWERCWWAYQWHIALRREVHGLGTCSGIAVHGAFDLRMLRTLLPTMPLISYPLCLPLGRPLPQPPRRPLRLVFVGALARAVNDEAARYLLEAIWPLIRVRVPDAELAIVGHGPSIALQRLAAQAPGVTLTGYVPDLMPWYAQSQVAVVSVLVSGGVLVKVLDAMALGRPVVTTTAGNEGVGAQPGRDLLVADDPEAFADAVAELFRSPTLASELVSNGRRFVEEHWDWRASFDRYEQFISSLC